MDAAVSGISNSEYEGALMAHIISLVMSAKMSRIFMLSCLGVSAAAFFRLPLPFAGEIAAFAGIVTVLFIPGSVVKYFLFRKTSDFDGLENLSIILCLGVSFWVIPSLIGFRLHLPLLFFVYLLLGMVLIYLRILILAGEKEKPVFIKGVTVHWPVVVFGVLSILFCISVYVSSRFQGDFFDTFYHIASMRQVAQGERLFGVPDVFVNGMTALSPYIDNVWYFIGGFISFLNHLPVTVVYMVMSFVLSMCAISAFYVLTKVFITRSWLSFIATVLYVCFWFFLIPFLGAYHTLFQNFFFAFLPYPAETVNMIIFPIVIAFYFRYLLNGKNSDIIAFGLLTMTAVSVHTSSVFFITFVILSGFITIWISKRVALIQTKRCLVLLFVFLLASGISCGFKTLLLRKAMYFASYVTSLKDYAAGKAGYCSWGDNLIMANPWWCIKGYPWQAVGLFVVPILFWAWRREDKSRLICLLACLLTPLLFLFNPLLSPLIARLFTTVLYNRLGWNSHEVLFRVPLLVAVALIVSNPKYVSGLRSDVVMPHRRAVIFFMLPFVILIGIFIYTPSRRVFVNALTNKKGFVDIKTINQEPLYLFLKEKIPVKSVVAAPEGLSYLIGALTPQKVIAIMAIRMSDFTQSEIRLADLERIIQFSGSEIEITRLLEKYDCRYVIVGATTQAAEKYRQCALTFKPVFDSEKWIIFKRIV